VDPRGYGSGTKLPHNIAALLGVMDGASSDLRTGLPWQMVEIHEPVRLLVLVETTADNVRSILRRTPAIARLIHNEWIHLAILDPKSDCISVHRNGNFVKYKPQIDRLPDAETSFDWYRGWRDQLEFASILGSSDTERRSRR
jgi:uncharacterized protein YbcC (UPF0753/DUF2309 family)